MRPRPNGFTREGSGFQGFWCHRVHTGDEKANLALCFGCTLKLSIDVGIIGSEIDERFCTIGEPFDLDLLLGFDYQQLPKLMGLISTNADDEKKGTTFRADSLWPATALPSKWDRAVSSGEWCHRSPP